MKALCFLALIPFATISYAQDCGGMANAGGTCVPPDVAMPGSQQQSQAPQLPPLTWVDQWGAIATYEPGGILGASTHMQSERKAKQSAMADCQTKGGGSNCKFIISYRNGCVALLVGDKFFNASSAATIEEATKSGMKVCAKNGNTNCHVYYSACSPPIVLQ